MSKAYPNNYRLPAEFEPQEAVWLSWPHNKESCPKTFHRIQDKFGEIASSISRYERVRINAPMLAHMNIRQEIEKAGPTELRAELFGKLIVDNGVTKVRLRDIDGEFIGRESGLSSPVPGKDGVFYVGKPIDKTKVKGDDWQAPEKDAKMRDLEQSVKEAQENCDKNFDGCKK